MSAGKDNALPLHADQWLFCRRQKKKKDGKRRVGASALQGVIVIGERWQKMSSTQ